MVGAMASSLVVASLFVLFGFVNCPRIEWRRAIMPIHVGGHFQMETKNHVGQGTTCWFKNYEAVWTCQMDLWKCPSGAEAIGDPVPSENRKELAFQYRRQLYYFGAFVPMWNTLFKQTGCEQY